MKFQYNLSIYYNYLFIRNVYLFNISNNILNNIIVLSIFITLKAYIYILLFYLSLVILLLIYYFFKIRL